MVNVATLERRYEFSGKQTAWIPSSQDILGGLTAIIFGYLGWYQLPVYKLSSGLVHRMSKLTYTCKHKPTDMYVYIHELGFKSQELLFI